MLSQLVDRVNLLQLQEKILASSDATLGNLRDLDRVRESRVSTSIVLKAALKKELKRTKKYLQSVS